MNLKDYLVTGISYLRQPKKRKLIEIAYSTRSMTGIEIGGPSIFFGPRAGCPVYIFADKIDGVNFSSETVWEGAIKEGYHYNYFKNKTGYQFIAEATALNGIQNGKYDFLLSCHSLEHVANPLKALKEWHRVLKEQGLLLLVLPDKRYTFDIHRPYTSFEHLIQDYQNETDENDTTHFEEILQFHDKTRDPGYQPGREISEVLKNNFQNRMAHHHVFSQELVNEMLEFAGFSVSYQSELYPFHLVTVAHKK